MSVSATSHAPPLARENARRIAVVAALSATTMLFASLSSAYLVRRSFADWRPGQAGWPFILLALGVLASIAIEGVARAEGRRRLVALSTLGISTVLYFLVAVSVIVSVATRDGGLASPHHGFIALLLGAHVLHAALGSWFAFYGLCEVRRGGSPDRIQLARLVTHFLTALLVAILVVLFVVR